MSFPKHLKEVPGDCQAVAPYNFVELPDRVVKAQLECDGKLRSSDHYWGDRHTGKIKCTLTTSSPLYTRCGLTTDQFKQGKEAKEFSDFFHTNPDTKDPVIPGSSLRGMIRALVEIASFGKIEKVTKNKLFFRSPGDPALREIYSSNFVEEVGQVQHSSHPAAPCYGSKVRAGFLRINGSSYEIEECGFGRINSQINSQVNQRIFPTLSGHQIYLKSGSGKTSNKIPNWNYQHKEIYVQIDSIEKDYFFKKQFKIDTKTGQVKKGKRTGQPEVRHPDLYLRYRAVHKADFEAFSDSQPATLVITGDMQHKHLEFVFLHEPKPLETYAVSEEIIRRFEDDDQITKWQEEAFPKDSPTKNCRKEKGYLRNREPIFFLLENDQKTVRFLGRAQMFRLPYLLSPLDFVPLSIRNPTETDIAEAIFGYVDGKDRDPARASRVHFTDGVLKSGQEQKISECLKREPTRILLASPKPTTFQHYLVQSEQGALQKKLKHYASEPDTETVIRGHKLYWHKGCSPKIEADGTASDTQTSHVKPIDLGIEFESNIYFENLTDVELGALLWVLDIAKQDKYRLSMGMGKPLGMGAVKITHHLQIDRLKERYQKLFSDNDWFIRGDHAVKKTTDYINIFKEYILKAIGSTEIFENLPRIAMLLHLLKWEEELSSEALAQRQYMTLEQFRSRPILPYPCKSSETKPKVTPPILKKNNLPSPNNSKKPSPDGDNGGNTALQRPPKPPKRT